MLQGTQTPPRKAALLWGAMIAAMAASAACSNQESAATADAPAPAPVADDLGDVAGLCATTEEAAAVRAFYSETRPGAVLPIPGRKLNMVESKIASGLLADNAVGVEGTPERLAEIWRSVDAWGEETNVRLVLSIDGWHPFDFPSKTPVTQAKHNQGFYDVYADGGAGVHIHLKPEDVSLIYAADLPVADGSSTRSVNLYDTDGRLILGVYASKAGKADFDEAAVTGFSATWDLIAGMPRACGGEGVEG